MMLRSIVVCAHLYDVESMLCIALGYSVNCFSVREFVELAMTLVVACAHMYRVRNMLWMELGRLVMVMVRVSVWVGLIFRQMFQI